MTNGHRSRSRRGQAWAMTKKVAHSTNCVGKETNQFDETGVDCMCKDTTAMTMLS